MFSCFSDDLKITTCSLRCICLHHKQGLFSGTFLPRVCDSLVTKTPLVFKFWKNSCHGSSYHLNYAKDKISGEGQLPRSALLIRKKNWATFWTQNSSKNKLSETMLALGSSCTQLLNFTRFWNGNVKCPLRTTRLSFRGIERTLFSCFWFKSLQIRR